MTPKRVVFIAGAGHSGSTLLDLLLGAQPGVIGVGEAHSLFRTIERDPASVDTLICGCGSSLRDCALWGRFLSANDTEQPRSMPARYELLLTVFGEHFGPEAALVDSSKSTAALRALDSACQSIAVVHLLRDVRSWSVAMRARDRRKGNAPGGPVRWAKDTVVRSTAGYFRTWHRYNRQLIDDIRGLDLPSVQVGYEELAFAPDLVLPWLLAALDIDVDHVELDPRASASHGVLGNRMAAQPSKRTGVLYDARWLTERSWLLPAAMMRSTMAFNTQHVYSNSHLLPWES